MRDSDDRAQPAQETLSQAQQLDDAAELANELYLRAQAWLGEDSGKKAAILALCAATGILGFYLGRQSGGKSA